MPKARFVSCYTRLIVFPALPLCDPLEVLTDLVTLVVLLRGARPDPRPWPNAYAFPDLSLSDLELLSDLLLDDFSSLLALLDFDSEDESEDDELEEDELEEDESEDSVMGLQLGLPMGLLVGLLVGRLVGLAVGFFVGG